MAKNALEQILKTAHARKTAIAKNAEAERTHHILAPIAASKQKAAKPNLIYPLERTPFYGRSPRFAPEIVFSRRTDAYASFPDILLVSCSAAAVPVTIFAIPRKAETRPTPTFTRTFSATARIAILAIFIENVVLFYYLN